MRRCLFIALIFKIVTTLKCSAQEAGISTSVQDTNSVLGVKIVTCNNDTTYFLLGRLIEPNFNSKVLLTKLNSNLDVIWSKYYYNFDNTIPLGINVLSDNAILISSITYDSLNKGTNQYFKLDTAGSILWSNRIIDSVYSLSVKYAGQVNDTIYLVGSRLKGSGWTNFGGDSQGVIATMNSLNGSLISNIAFKPANSLFSATYQGVLSSFNDKIYCLTELILDSISTSSNSVILIFDKNLSLEKAVLLSDSTNFRSPILMLSELTGSLFVGVGYYSHSYPAENYLLCLLDTDANIIYSYENGPSIWQNYFSAASFYMGDNLKLIKSNSLYDLNSNGTITQSKVIYNNIPSSINYTLSDMITNESNTIIYGSILSGTGLPWRQILVKTDSLGNSCNPILFNDTSHKVIILSPSLIQVDTLNSLNYSQSTGGAMGLAQGLWISDCVSSITEEKKSSGFEVFPNPFERTLVIKNSAASSVKISVIDMLGKKIYERKCCDSEINLELSEIPQGLYILTIEQYQAIPISIKIIKS